MRARRRRRCASAAFTALPIVRRRQHGDAEVGPWEACRRQVGEEERVAPPSQHRVARDREGRMPKPNNASRRSPRRMPSHAVRLHQYHPRAGGRPDICFASNGMARQCKTALRWLRGRGRAHLERSCATALAGGDAARGGHHRVRHLGRGSSSAVAAWSPTRRPRTDGRTSARSLPPRCSRRSPARVHRGHDLRRIARSSPRLSFLQATRLSHGARRDRRSDRSRRAYAGPLRLKRCADGYVVGSGEARRAAATTAATLDRAIHDVRAATGRPVTTREPLASYRDDASLVRAGDWLFPIVQPWDAEQRDSQAACGWTIVRVPRPRRARARRRADGDRRRPACRPRARSRRRSTTSARSSSASSRVRSRSGTSTPSTSPSPRDDAARARTGALHAATASPKLWAAGQMHPTAHRRARAAGTSWPRRRTRRRAASRVVVYRRRDEPLGARRRRVDRRTAEATGGPTCRGRSPRRRRHLAWATCDAAAGRPAAARRSVAGARERDAPAHVIDAAAMEDLLRRALDARVGDVLPAPTPLDPAPNLSARLGVPCSLKREDLTPGLLVQAPRRATTGWRTLDERRARDRRRSRRRPATTRRAWRTRRRGSASTRAIVMPRTTPVDQGRTRSAGSARRSSSSATTTPPPRRARRRSCATSGRTPIPPFDDLDVIAGQGTIGLELLHQAPRDIERRLRAGRRRRARRRASRRVMKARPAGAARDRRRSPTTPTRCAARSRAGSRVVLEHVGIFADGVAVAAAGRAHLRALPALARRLHHGLGRRDLRRHPRRLPRHARRCSSRRARSASRG